MPVHLASNTGGTWLTTFSIAKSRKPINNLSTGPSLLFFGRKIKAALVGIPALLGMPIFLSRRYAPVFEVEPVLPKVRNGAKGVFLSRSILFNNSATYLRQESTLCARTRNKSAVSCKNPYRDSMPGLSTKYIRSRSFCASVNRSRRVSKRRIMPPRPWASCFSSIALHSSEKC